MLRLKLENPVRRLASDLLPIAIVEALVEGVDQGRFLCRAHDSLAHLQARVQIDLARRLLRRTGRPLRSSRAGSTDDVLQPIECRNEQPGLVSLI